MPPWFRHMMTKVRWLFALANFSFVQSLYIDGNCKTARDKLTVQAIYYTSEVPTSVALYDYISPSTLTICYIPSHVNYCIPFKGKSVNF